MTGFKLSNFFLTNVMVVLFIIKKLPHDGTAFCIRLYVQLFKAITYRNTKAGVFNFCSVRTFHFCSNTAHAQLRIELE